MEFRHHYDSEYDILSVSSANEKVSESVEFSEDIVLDLNKEGKIIGIEIFYVSEFFNAFNKEIDKDFLENLEAASIEYKEYRNMWFIVLALNSRTKKISQPLPPLRKSEYVSPIVQHLQLQ